MKDKFAEVVLNNIGTNWGHTLKPKFPSSLSLVTGIF